MRWKRSIVGLALAAALFFAPGLFTVYWHLRHGNAVVHMGKRVPVPWGWFAEIDFHTVRFNKLPVTIPPILFSDKLFFSTGWIHPIPFSKPEQAPERYKTHEVIFWILQERTDRIVADPFRMGSGDTEAFCMRASSKGGQWRSMASCLLFQGTWQADFLGDERDVALFLQVVRETKSTGASH